jgi:hypothetical protein
VQREKLVNVVAPIEEFDPSARDRNVLLRHVPHTISGLLLPERGAVQRRRPREPRGRCGAQYGVVGSREVRVLSRVAHKMPPLEAIHAAVAWHR